MIRIIQISSVNNWQTATSNKYIETLIHDALGQVQLHFSVLKIMLYRKYPVGTLLEVLNYYNFTQMRLGTVTECIGDRIQVTYYTQSSSKAKRAQGKDSTEIHNWHKRSQLYCSMATWFYFTEVHWFSVHSELVVPLGWSKAVGYNILERNNEKTNKHVNLRLLPSDPESIALAEGQLLEACSPHKVNTICAASVHAVLKHGYFIVAFRISAAEANFPTLYPFHLSSLNIFPCGFCAEHGIDLQQPFEHKHLTAKQYLKLSQANAAQLRFIKSVCWHNLKYFSHVLFYN